MNWLHTWGGFAFGWLIYFIFITGSVGYFENEIDRWMKPEMVVVNNNSSQATLLANAENHLKTVAPNSPQWYIGFPVERSPFVGISWLQLANKETQTPKKFHVKNIHPQTSELINARETGGGRVLYRMHYNLHYIPQNLANWIISLASMLMLISLVTGIIIHKKIFLEFFTFRANKGLRAWLDIHNIFSVLPLPFHLMITYSGLLLLMGISMSMVIDVTYGEDKKNHSTFYKESHSDIKQHQFISVPPQQLSLSSVLNDSRTRFKNQRISYIGLIDQETKNEHYEVFFDQFNGIELASTAEYRIKDNRVQLETSHGKKGNALAAYDVFEHLHEGLFANIYLRWLYFFSGLLGAGMMATGMILWIKKRLKNTDREKKFSTISLIERMNVAVIMGVPIAITAYFWSNRLLPVTMVNRANWEIHCLFITLFTCLVFCLFRPIKTLWKNMLWLAASACILLPVLNAITTDHNILSSIQKSDWLMLGFDLSMLFFGACFAISALLVTKQDDNLMSRLN
jgi:uncharacterized iron-regulated membrane protein